VKLNPSRGDPSRLGRGAIFASIAVKPHCWTKSTLHSVERPKDGWEMLWLSVVRLLTSGAFIESLAANTCARAGQRAHEEI
jgi:hypothetical protein